MVYPPLDDVVGVLRLKAIVTVMLTTGIICCCPSTVNPLSVFTLFIRYLLMFLYLVCLFRYIRITMPMVVVVSETSLGLPGPAQLHIRVLIVPKVSQAKPGMKVNSCFKQRRVFKLHIIAIKLAPSVVD